MLIVEENVAEHGTAVTENNFVSFILLLVIADKSHISKALLIKQVSEGFGQPGAECFPCQPHVSIVRYFRIIESLVLCEVFAFSSALFNRYTCRK